MVAEPLDPIPLSALQHWCYCPRQCVLIHIEQVFAENLYTQRGQALHKRVDDPGFELRDGLRVERELPLFSDGPCPPTIGRGLELDSNNQKPATRAGSGDSCGQPEILPKIEMAISGAAVQSR